MPDTILTPVHALAAAPQGRFGASDGDGPLTMTAPAEGTVLMLLETGAADLAAALKDHGGFDVRHAGPGQYLAVRDTPLTLDAHSDIEKALVGNADVVDQSSARVRIVIEGKSVRDMLAKGIPIDLHPNQFEIGRAATTLCGHIGVHLTRTGDDRFDILVTRSYAVALWESLFEMGLEYGIDCHHV
jgi:sarcosine oxidase subunit gamma